MAGQSGYHRLASFTPAARRRKRLIYPHDHSDAALGQRLGCSPLQVQPDLAEQEEKDR